MKNHESRRTIRHRGAFPVKLENTKGITRDFSSSGIFFETDKSFTPGQKIEFTIVLEYVDPGRPVHLKCRGEIIRVEDRGHKLGIATNIKSYTFQQSNPSGAGNGKPAKKMSARVRKCH